MTGTSTYNVLVVGAGPAGCAAAWALGRLGLTVALVDQHAFPRDKVCGDALIPDALGALHAMGMRSDVNVAALRLGELRVFVPDGRHVSIRGEFSCLPRMRLDALLVDAAVRAGATLIEDATAVASRAAGGRVTGATFRRANGPLAIDAQFTLLATGANATIMSAFGLSPPMKPNAVAGRAYYQVPPEVADQCRYLCIAYDRPLCPGYGWIFPGPDNRFNVGVGLFSSGVPGRRLQDVWRRFITKFEPAAAIVRQSAPLTEFKGAPMRTGLAAGPLGKPGLLVVGEAAATTYPATGEGIGKAMESGLLAARLVSDAIAGRRSAADLHQAYESEFREQFFPRYRAYGVAQAWSSHPWMLNILARRAHAGSFVRTELESLIAEQDDPSRLFSAKGLLTLLFH